MPSEGSVDPGDRDSGTEPTPAAGNDPTTGPDEQDAPLKARRSPPGTDTEGTPLADRTEPGSTDTASAPPESEPEATHTSGLERLPPEPSEPDITEPAGMGPPVPANVPDSAPGTPMAPPPAPGDEPPVPKARRRLRWVMLPRVAWALLVAGLLGIGGTGGWMLRSWLDDPDLPPIEASVDRPVILSETADALSSDGAPNVLGLPEDEGRQVFANLGISGSDIRVEEVPAAGQPGLVVAQRPPPGASLEETATLFVSVEAEVPDVVGLPENEAYAALSDLGARIVIERVYDEGADEGAVIAVEPGVGKTLGDTVTLQVGAPPSSVFLVELNPVESDCSTTDSATLGGTAVGRSLVCDGSSYGDEPAAAEYVLNRRVSFVEATIGIDDRSSSRSPVTVRVYVDDQVGASERVAFGDAVDLRVPVSGALRLRIEVSGADDPYADQPEAVIGDARLVGSRDAIDALVLESE